MEHDEHELEAVDLAVIAYRGFDGAPVIHLDGDCPGLRVYVNDDPVWTDPTPSAAPTRKGVNPTSC